MSATKHKFKLAYVLWVVLALTWWSVVFFAFNILNQNAADNQARVDEGKISLCRDHGGSTNDALKSINGQDVFVYCKDGSLWPLRDTK